MNTNKQFHELRHQSPYFTYYEVPGNYVAFQMYNTEQAKRRGNVLDAVLVYVPINQVTNYK